MAKDREYTIVIKNQGGGKKSPISGDKGESSTEKGKGILTKEGAKAFGKAMVAYGVVKSFATQAINHEVSMVQLRTGSNELQGRASFINEVAQKAVNFGESIVAGALVGGVGGAIAGGVLSIMHTAIGYMQNQERINTERSLENVSLNMRFVRAGANSSRGSQ